MAIDGIIGLVLLALSAISVLVFIFIKQKRNNNGEEGTEKPEVPMPDAKWKDVSTVIIDTGSTSLEKEINITGDTFVSILVDGDKDAIKIEPQSGDNLKKVKISVDENDGDSARVFKLTVKNS